jgi:hypothetical protein
MPALNVNFTGTELEQLRERARNEGKSMRDMAHDTIVNCNRQSAEDDRITAAVARVMRLSADLLARLADQ